VRRTLFFAYLAFVTAALAFYLAIGLLGA